MFHEIIPPKCLQLSFEKATSPLIKFVKSKTHNFFPVFWLKTDVLPASVWFPL